MIRPRCPKAVRERYKPKGICWTYTAHAEFERLLFDHLTAGRAGSRVGQSNLGRIWSAAGSILNGIRCERD